MKTIFVNIKKETVTVNNETCNFIEAGLMPNGQKVSDEDEIEEYFNEKYDDNFIIIFE